MGGIQLPRYKYVNHFREMPLGTWDSYQASECGVDLVTAGGKTGGYTLDYLK